MTDIWAKVIADSISETGHRMTTMHLRYPRFIHAESKTHRLHTETGEVVEELVSPGVMNDPNLSRNARSSRAVPVPTMIREIMENPVIPIHWGAAQKGMQAYQENKDFVAIGLDHDHTKILSREDAWLFARDRAVEVALGFHNAGYHKQVINRLLEPFMHIDTLVSATEWSNFLALRDHHAAEPHIQALARAVKVAFQESTPTLLHHGQWHLPYITDADDDPIWDYVCGNGGAGPREASEILEVCKKVSTARCARISYTPFDGKGDIESEINRYDLLVGSAPIHASPAEHQATPDRYDPELLWAGEIWESDELHGNLKGWKQYRKTLEGECL